MEKKIVLTKSENARIAATVIVNKITSPPHDGGVTYQQRKSNQTQYQDLFRALFLIPDKLLQQRVMNAINGETTVSLPATSLSMKCPKCNTLLVRQQSQASTATQTNDIAFDAKSISNSEPNSTNNSDDSRDIPDRRLLKQQQEITNAEEAEPDNTGEGPQQEATVKKRRKRKVCLPHVVKRSHTQNAPQQLLQPKLKKPKLSVIKHTSENSMEIIDNNLKGPMSVMRPRSDSIISNFSVFDHFEEPSVEQILVTMRNEFRNSELCHDGLRPIHNAVLCNDIFTLQRQIFVWKKMKNIDLNHVVTDEEEDCLQLAIINDCFPKTIEILLGSGLDANCIDTQSNTSIHLAILHEIEVDSLALLMKHIDLSILLQLNDDGYTPLHIAIRHDRYLHAEIMLDVLDERLVGDTTYKRQKNKDPAASASAIKDEFLKFYEKACTQLENKYGNNTSGVAQPKLKKKLLEVGEMKSGNTALFFAIENKMEHLAYFLLAHLSDPRIQNHSGQDVKTFFGEFGKLLNLSFKVDTAMENVIKFIV